MSRLIVSGISATTDLVRVASQTSSMKLRTDGRVKRVDSILIALSLWIELSALIHPSYLIGNVIPRAENSRYTLAAYTIACVMLY